MTAEIPRPLNNFCWAVLKFQTKEMLDHWEMTAKEPSVTFFGPINQNPPCGNTRVFLGSSPWKYPHWSSGTCQKEFAFPLSLLCSISIILMCLSMQPGYPPFIMIVLLMWWFRSYASFKVSTLLPSATKPYPTVPGRADLSFPRPPG